MRRKVRLKTTVWFNGGSRAFPPGKKGEVVGEAGDKVDVIVNDTVQLGDTVYKGTVVVQVSRDQVEFIPTHEPIPPDFEVQPLRPGQQAKNPRDTATCGHCGLSWDDGQPTTYTPAPSARCPFEAFHLYDGK